MRITPFFLAMMLVIGFSGGVLAQPQAIPEHPQRVFSNGRYLPETFKTPDDHKPSDTSKPLQKKWHPSGVDVELWYLLREVKYLRHEVRVMQEEIVKMKASQMSMVKSLKAWIWKNEKRQPVGGK